jgi:hypothetical protein
VRELQMMRKARPFQWFMWVCICTFPPGCKHEDHNAHATEVNTVVAADTSLRPGDVLFQDLDCGPLCDAIEAVTEGIDGKDFSHAGMIVRVGDTLAVIEAIGPDVHLTSMRDFHQRNSKVLTRHVKPIHRALADRAAAHALGFIGTPYDDAFLPDNGKLYCSELIAMAYERANSGKAVFAAPPMTFKDPRTSQFFPVWVLYYKELGLSIPEGEAGCNPGGLSRNDDLFEGG